MRLDSWRNRASLSQQDAGHKCALVTSEAIDFGTCTAQYTGDRLDVSLCKVGMVGGDWAINHTDPYLGDPSRSLH